MATNNSLSELARLLRGDSAGQQVTTITQQLQQLKGINDVLAQESAAAMAQSTAQAGGGSTAGSILGTIGGFLGGGLGLVPLISGLSDLFGGDEQDSPPPLTRYLPPAGIQLNAGVSDGAVFATDRGQGNLARPITQSAAPQITVQVQAMDSQSFLDRSQDIASAVRQAMLETTVLNDVIREV